MDALFTNWHTIVNYFILALIIVIGLLVIWLVDRNEKIKDIKTSLNKLDNSFNELDAQAKLIVKTDLELNKAQEELDKRLNGLDALQKTSRLISTTLDENEIFNRLHQPLLTELGFEKYLILIADKKKQLQNRVDVGFAENEIQGIIEQINQDSNILKDLVEHQIISSVKKKNRQNDNLTQLFNVRHFVMAPILAQNKVLGILFAGNQSDAFAFTEGDEELISILADQISQALENARLFEEVYRSSQILESKVEERTRQLSKVLNEVQQISKTKSEFISAVSHELRTPLTSIKGYASILMTGKVGEIPEKVKERLAKINIHSDNLVKLINDLLDISRIESGRIEMKFTKSNIKDMVEEVIDLLTPQIKEKDITTKAEIDDPSLSIFMDVSQVERVFINLVSNAIKFTPVKGTITIKVKPHKEGIVASVMDTGIGISEENIAKLFNEFYRVENEVNLNVKGTGLGLALAKKIVEAHQGRIWVESKPHKGSTFHFTLPLDARAALKKTET